MSLKGFYMHSTTTRLSVMLLSKNANYDEHIHTSLHGGQSHVHMSPSRPGATPGALSQPTGLAN